MPLYLPDVVANFWSARTPNVGTVDLTDTQFTVFYDAAWELARIGVLRPGGVAPRNQEVANDFGDHWSIVTKNGNLIDSFYNASASTTSLRTRRWSSTTIATPLPAMRAMPVRARAFGNSPQMTKPDTTPHSAKQ